MMILEANGAQHYGPVNWSGCMTDEDLEDQFENQMYRDNLKVVYTSENEWPILWISHLERKNLTSIVTSFLDTFKDVLVFKSVLRNRRNLPSPSPNVVNLQTTLAHLAKVVCKFCW
jgi:hypothetical protein